MTTETQTSAMPDAAFWKDKRVLLTGHTGFKGGWAALWLTAMGAKVTGVGLAPEPGPALFELADIAGKTDSHIADIRDADAMARHREGRAARSGDAHGRPGAGAPLDP
jgi:CDP-glucose 4,6-dehydratase